MSFNRRQSLKSLVGERMVSNPIRSHFADIPGLAKAYDVLSSLFNYDMKALIAQ